MPTSKKKLMPWKKNKAKPKKKNHPSKKTPPPEVYKSPKRFPSLLTAAIFCAIGYALPFFWLPAVASTFFVIGPLCFFAGYLVYLELCKLFDIWPFEPTSTGLRSILNLFNPLSYIISPNDIVKGTLAFINVIKEGFQMIVDYFKSWAKTVDDTAAQNVADFERRYIDNREPISRDFDTRILHDEAQHREVFDHLRRTRRQHNPDETLAHATLKRRRERLR